MNEEWKKILLIGDEVSNLQLLAEACRQLNIAASVASGFELAREQLVASHYDLLVFDLDLKRKPNIEFICLVDEALPYTPLMLLTHDYQQSQQLIFGLFELDIKGSWHILEKPFLPLTFSGHIQDVLREEEKALHPEAIRLAETRGESRRYLRKQQFQPIRFSYEQTKYGSRFKTVTRGFLTDVSLGGIGMLTNRCLEEQQYLSFENGLFCGTGRVAWRTTVDEMTHKVGICFG